MYCIDDLEFIKFYGNFNTDNSQSFRLELYTCASDPTNKKCKDPKDLIKAKKWPFLLTLTNNQKYEQENYDIKIVSNESLLAWNRLSLVSPFQKSQVIQQNSIVASDSISRLGDAKTIKYFTTKEVSNGPVEDSLTGAIIAIVFEASLDTTIDVRVVYNILSYISQVGGFSAFFLMLTYALATVWNSAFLTSFLVSRIFLKKHTGQDITNINLGWTSITKAWNKADFMTRAKGLKRVETEIDVVRLIRRMFVVDYLTKHLMSPAKMAEITKKGKFIIQPDLLQDHKLSSEDSESGDAFDSNQGHDVTQELDQVSHFDSEKHSELAKLRQESGRIKFTSA